MKNFKLLSTVIILALILTNISTLPAGVKAYAEQQDEVETKVEKQKEDIHSFTMNDPELYQEAKDLGLTDEEIIKMDKEIESILEGNHLQNPVAVVVGVVVGIIGIGTANYSMGKYAAKQVHKRGILSVSTYKKYRWQFRAALPPAIGVPATLGFDDYFYGI
ncbi:hypothetical protein [Pseudogracilibacillus sp. SO30301A]|uniref:hypothetical protein n=1 Tax=Pseudogracilibacillus sp. SO30301A TaxID=3098291 RepID=UPI00300DE819